MLMSNTHTPHHDAPKIPILGPVCCSGKAPDCLHRGKSCLGSNPALGLVSKPLDLTLVLVLVLVLSATVTVP